MRSAHAKANVYEVTEVIDVPDAKLFGNVDTPFLL